ncbi:MAG: hypothetical protein IPO65_06970 [Saprospiraceae bacterium]|nr:hypothetical protein [Saprospiraceae bacterium]
MNQHKIVSLVICLSALFRLNAQIEVSMPNPDILILSDIYNMEINNPSGNPYTIQFLMELRKDNKIVYEVTTNQYSIVQPLSQTNEGVLQPLQVTRNLVDQVSGSYTLDVKVLDVNTKQILFANRFQIQSLRRDMNTEGKDKKSLDLQFSGNAAIYGQMASMQGIGSAVPQNFLRAEIYPDLTFKGIPVGLDILYSTEQNAFRQSINQVALRFDAQQFKQQMQQRLQSKVRSIEAIGSLTDINDLNSLKDKTMSKQFPKLNEWEAQLKDPKIQEGLGQLKQLESFDQIINDPEVKSTLSRKSALERKSSLTEVEKEEMKQLISYAAEIEKIKARAEQIRSISKEYQQYKGVGKKIAQAKKYADKDMFKDPGFLKNGLKSLGGLSKAEQLLGGFDAISVGTSFPFYSRLSLSSLPVNGVHVEWNPGKLYLAATYGKSARQTLNTDFTKPQLTLAQNILATKLGYGSPQSTHLYLTYINISDRFNELSLNNNTKPQANKIIGTEGQVSLLGDKIKMGGELMASLLTRDHTIVTEGTQDFRKEAIPLSSLFGNVNNASSFDLAWKAHTEIRVIGNATKIKANIERVGPNYFSLGAPNLLNDMLRWKAEVRQTFLQNKITLSAFARQDANALDPLLTSVRSTTKSYGLSGNINIPKLPTLSLSFSPYAQNNEVIATNQDLNTNATMLNLNLGYAVNLSKQLSTYTQLTYLAQNLNSNISGIDYNLKMYGIVQAITYNMVSLNIAANYTPNQIIGNVNMAVATFNANGSFLLFNKWQNGVGIQFLSVSGLESKSGYMLTSSCPLFKFADVELRVQRNIYNNLTESTDFNETIAWTGLRVKW